MPVSAHENQLIHEKSPYLLQHAYNPVNWYPWGEEAFSKAKKENKLVFLSIGYSTCHWCHVMAHESFEDEEVADTLNNLFVSIKVDKEERPDIDSVYMGVCQMLTGQGGWPLTIIMTPDKKPIFAGTYFPKHSRYNMPGILDILSALAAKWREDPSELIASGEEITKVLQQENGGGEGTLSKDILIKTCELFHQTFDEKYGGFGRSPKFPTPHHILFLLRYAYFEKDNRALKMAEKTLQQMYRGGMFDHIGFGFSRYSTDAKWLVPHFEKMLYDNALLTIAYLEAFQITRNELYKAVAVKVMEYVLRELTDENGGFYCAQDADSEGVEGKYYVFTPDEIISCLGEADGTYFNKYFGITEQGNFEGKSIPNLLSNQEFAERNDRIEKLSKLVFSYRMERTSLHKDDKILTSWNALMIAAFSKAYRILGDERYLRTAERAVSFLESKLMKKDGHLFVRYRDGETSGDGHVDDYAFLVWALLELYQATFDCSYLTKALTVNETLVHDFFDEKSGGFYLYGKNSESLISRPKELYDGAIPSGNSVAAYNLFQISKLTGDAKLEELASKQLSFMAANVQDYPAGYSFAMMAFMLALYPSRELVCVVKNPSDLHAIQTALGRHFAQNTVVLLKDEQNKEELGKIAEFTKAYDGANDEMTFYLCENNACSPPFHGISELEEKIKE
ncbi:MAG TPA: thioredoxin domain-containing protein [Oscillospiraceae bacterium]|nr:thioredoxin domain-containing protein [Oscillospiraceae bacterium]